MKDFPSLRDVYRRFPTKETCFSFMEKVRWNNEPRCPHCSSTRVTPMRGQFRHHCNACNSSFSVTVNTLFHNTRVPLQKWFAAIVLYLENDKGLTVRNLAEALEVNKNTAWTMLNRLREARQDREFFRRIIGDFDLYAYST